MTGGLRAVFWFFGIIIFALITVAGLAWLAAAIVADSLPPMLVSVLHTRATDLEKFGYTGGYLQFLLGVTVTILIAAISGLASLVFHNYNQTKDDIGILEFIERITTPISDEMRSIVHGFREMVSQGNDLRKRIEDIVEHSLGEYPDDIVSDHRPASPAEAQPSDWLKTMLDKVEQDPKATEALKNLNATIEEFRDSYENIMSYPYSRMVLKHRLDELGTMGRSPLFYLSKIVPPAHRSRLGLDGAVDDPRFVLDLLGRFVNLTVGVDFVRAVVELQNPYTIEFTGYMIYAPWIDFGAPYPKDRTGQRDISGYVVNWGAAALLSLYDFLPRTNNFQKAFEDLFGKRSRLWIKYVRQIHPDPDRFAPVEFGKSIRAEMMDVELPRLVLVRFTDGTLEWYDPKEHGALKEGHLPWL
jgi:hypothetical protein